MKGSYICLPVHTSVHMTFSTFVFPYVHWYVHMSINILALAMPISNSGEIHDYPYWLINARWCRLLCASSNYIPIYSCTLSSAVLTAHFLFIEQDVGTHFYITESHSMYAFSCLFIMIMIIDHKTKCSKETFINIINIIKCDKGHNFVICCIALHQWEFFLSNIIQNRSKGPSPLAVWKLASMLKISSPKVLLCSFHQCEKFWNLELCTVVFCMSHTKYQCISLESFLPAYQTMIHYKQSKTCLVFSYFHQFLELVEEDANLWALQLCLVCPFVYCDIEQVVFSVKHSQTLL